MSESEVSSGEDFGVCDKCRKGRMVKKYSSKNSQHFLSCNTYPVCKNTKPYRSNSSTNLAAAAITIKDEFTNLFKLNLAPFPRKLFILSADLRADFPEAAFFEQTKLVTIKADPRLVEIPLEIEKIKFILYRYIRHKFSQYQGVAVLTRKFTEENFNEVVFTELPHPTLGNSYLEYFHICQAFKFALHYSDGQFYLSVEPTLRVVNQMSVSQIIQLYNKPDLLEKLKSQNTLSCFYYITDSKGVKWRRKGVLADILKQGEQEDGLLPILQNDIIPIFPIERMQNIVNKLVEKGKLTYIDLNNRLKGLTQLKSQERLASAIVLVNKIAAILNGKIDTTRVVLEKQPVSQNDFYKKVTILSEPNLRFDSIQDSKKSIKVKEGLVLYGAYEKPPKPVRILFLHSAATTKQARQFSLLLQNGVDGYYGFEKHFHTTLEIDCQIYEEKDFEIFLTRIVIGRAEGYDVIIYQLPADPSFTKTKVQAQLINGGIVSQCVREPTFNGPNQFTLWNFALDLYVKAGYTPWTLYPKEKLPNVDLFIGISYSSKKEKAIAVSPKLLRTLACINVFSADGEWQQAYYNADTFDEEAQYDFEKRGQNVGKLIRDAVLAAQLGQPNLKKIHIHYNKIFSKEEMNSVYKAITKVIPDAILYFVSIADNHTVRLFNSNNVDAHQQRGGGILFSDNTLYYCTSGYSSIKTTVKGTPVILRIKCHTMPAQHDLSMNDLAMHMQALTKLNYKATFPLTTLPATVAFPKELARTINDFRSINQFKNIIIDKRLWWI
ncbi:topoisomerase DNA-binding C4 zinc finger domain-containing protein [Adhaeribacter radiodurans]|uniref:Protein argonaute n=1 Tax=Adhaeribacter radiodurans TaxID=2745197 RepID=A0A7L7L190_9BACT|nr:topoisomerase DNA-binding C4 zinc finger domain-containing protein [Adhaeribacter radiodurans]QMU26550.1 topoisomerase DNA-binding C4 zinc finger domain-containing protein [Adhaeribacter radiodurans]